ncbi:hypothetical protein RvY_03459 [Ramazzottius varieornatus]|uniref:Hydroxylysine kinase n=1 Tax=Ramazzottius varieornatus TaxID=947166 RepID=A0A1D1URW7_RAMVA|nr:hypothetical protein RvY_03459 [Ramazzottius varieornatus]
MGLPVLTDTDIRDLVAEVFGLKVTSSKRLDGYDDVNYHVKVSPTSQNAHFLSLSEDGYILKIGNPNVSSNLDNIDAQNAMMMYLNENLSNVEVSLPLPSTRGNYKEVVNVPLHENVDPLNGDAPPLKVVVRMLTFIKGTTMFHVKSEPGREVLISIGRLTGQLIHSLKGFDHPGVITAKEFRWSLENAPDVEDKMHAVDDPNQRGCFSQVLADFEDMKKKWCDKCPQGIIFGDLNEGNIFLEELPVSCWDSAEYYVKGIVDFADHHRCCSVFELALSMCYMMLESCRKGTVRPIEAGGLVLAGYLQSNTLTEGEQHMLKISIEARCVQSLVMGQYSFKYIYPDNLYVLNTQTSGWQVLQQLRQLTAKELWSIWDQVLSAVNTTDGTLTNDHH